MVNQAERPIDKHYYMKKLSPFAENVNFRMISVIWNSRNEIYSNYNLKWNRNLVSFNKKIERVVPNLEITHMYRYVLVAKDINGVRKPIIRPVCGMIHFTTARFFREANFQNSTLGCIPLTRLRRKLMTLFINIDAFQIMFWSCGYSFTLLK